MKFSLDGVKTLVSDESAILTLIVFVVCAIALFTKHLDGTSFAVVIGTLSAIYNVCSHRINIAQINANAAAVPPAIPAAPPIPVIPQPPDPTAAIPAAPDVSAPPSMGQNPNAGQ